MSHGFYRMVLTNGFRKSEYKMRCGKHVVWGQHAPAGWEEAGKGFRSFLSMPGIYLGYLDNGGISPGCDWLYFLETGKTPSGRL